MIEPVATALGAAYLMAMAGQAPDPMLRWGVLAETGDTTHFIGLNTATGGSTNRSIISMAVLRRPAGDGTAARQTAWTIDCAARRYQEVQHTALDATMRTLATAAGTRQWTSLTSGSLAGGVAMVACGEGDPSTVLPSLGAAFAHGRRTR